MKKRNFLAMGMVAAFLFNGVSAVEAASNEDLAIINSEIYENLVEEFVFENDMSVWFNLENNTVLGVHTPGMMTDEELKGLELEAIKAVILAKSEEYTEAKNENLSSIQLEELQAEILNNSSEFKRVSEISLEEDNFIEDLSVRGITSIAKQTIGPFASKVYSIGTVGVNKTINYTLDTLVARNDIDARANGVKLVFADSSNGSVLFTRVILTVSNGYYTNYNSSKTVKLTIQNQDTYARTIQGQVNVY